MTNTYSNRQRVALGLQQPTGVWTNGFTYDAAGRLTNVTSQAGTFTYSYLAPIFNLPASISLPNGATNANGYDPVARLLSTVLKNSSGTALDSALYGYNSAGQRTAYTNAAGTYVQYTYDPISQIKVASSSLGRPQSRGYAYDNAWNLSFVTNTFTYSLYQVDTRNQLTNWGGVTQNYDANGSLSNQVSLDLTYTYDDENRLTQVEYWLPNGGCANATS